MKVDSSGALRPEELTRMADILTAHGYAVVAPGIVTVTISRSDFDSLKEDEDTLRKLENAGVDNWTWYSEAINHPESFE